MTDKDELESKLGNRKRGTKQTSLKTAMPKKRKGSSLSSKKNTNKQLCTAIVKFRKEKTLHKKNLDYIQKEGKGLNEGEPTLYGSEENLQTYEQNIDDVSWRIILSPENQEVNLDTLTKDFISSLEKTTGFKFSWIAANHYDTEHKHTHILINGKDKLGKKIIFQPKELIKTQMREYAQNICTTLVGERTETQIEKYKEQNISKDRYTDLDKEIEKKMINSKIYTTNLLTERLQKRIAHLAKLNLCTFNETEKTYTFEKGWQESLKVYGKYNSFLEGLKIAQVHPSLYELKNLQSNEKVSGIVLKKFTLQNSNNFAVVLKEKDGKIKYVPLGFYPKCQNGDHIQIKKTGNKSLLHIFLKSSKGY